MYRLHTDRSDNPYNCRLLLQNTYCRYKMYMNLNLVLNTFRLRNHYNCRCRCLPNTFPLHNHNIVMNLLVRIFRLNMLLGYRLRSDNSDLPYIPSMLLTT